MDQNGAHYGKRVHRAFEGGFRASGPFCDRRDFAKLARVEVHNTTGFAEFEHAENDRPGLFIGWRHIDSCCGRPLALGLHNSKIES